MNTPIAAAVPPDLMREADVPRLVRSFRDFLGREGIVEAEHRLAERREDGNPFRSQLLDEKQPWIATLSEYDIATDGGARPLARKDLSENILLLAYAASMLERIAPTLPRSVTALTRARLLDLDGRTVSLIMEWECACFYLRRGYALTWTEPNAVGPEFRASNGTWLSVDVECVRFRRNWLEVLSDQHACNAALGVWSAVAKAGALGVWRLDVLNEDLPSAAEIEALVASVPAALLVADARIEVPGVGTLSRPVEFRGVVLDSREHVERATAAKPHDCRAVGASPRAGTDDREGVVLWIAGRRRSMAALVTYISDTLARKAARQLREDVPGVLVAEVEDITDANLYATRQPFYDVTERVFTEAPWVASLIWRCGMRLETTENGCGFVHDAFNLRNRRCKFPQAAAIPLLDVPRESARS